MATTQPERPSSPPEHQVTGRDYPIEWARRVELYLDEGPRRLIFYGGLFAAFVLAVLVSLIAGLAA